MGAFFSPTFPLSSPIHWFPPSIYGKMFGFIFSWEKTVQKKNKDLSRGELKNLLAVARGDQEADLLIKNVKILDLVCGETLDSAIVLSNRHIAGVGKEYEDAKAKKVWDAQGSTVVPGFIDGHLHIESSMMHPFEFERLTLPLGTTTAICDPHEITTSWAKRVFLVFKMLGTHEAKSIRPGQFMHPLPPRF